MSETPLENGERQPAIAGREYKMPNYSLYVWIADNRLECRCSYVPRHQGDMMTHDELRGYLTDAGVKEGIDDEAVKGFAIKAAAGTELRMVLLASGVPPVDGADGRLSYCVQPSITIQEEVDEGSTVDMHHVQSFLNVVPGEQIARIIPPEPGSPGRNIAGVVLPPQPGKALNLKVGKNIHCEEDGFLLVADAAGRVCQASGEMSVEEEYVVAGDVDFRVGSIKFNGFAEVRGDILDDFDVAATKGMRIGGNIGISHIRSDGDIAFCGMDGQGKGTIVCGGSINANFIHDCIVECIGDVNIEVEVHNCTIRTLGRIIVNRGAISGGCCTALGGIEARRIGSFASVRTKLVAGVDYHDMEELEQKFAELDQIQTRLGQAQSTQEIEELRKARAVLTDSILKIRSKEDTRANPKINVKQAIYENVLLSYGSFSEEIREQLDGPLSITENTIEGGLRLLQLTSLDVKARDLEIAFAREQK
jgi:uncharacterized protein (DUF342 family)